MFVMAEFTHTICERCWFERNTDRFPVQVKREDQDFYCDLCCYCGSTKVTRIFCRDDPGSSELVCNSDHSSWAFLGEENEDD